MLLFYNSPAYSQLLAEAQCKCLSHFSFRPSPGPGRPSSDVPVLSARLRRALQASSGLSARGTPDGHKPSSRLRPGGPVLPTVMGPSSRLRLRRPRLIPKICSAIRPQAAFSPRSRFTVLSRAQPIVPTDPLLWSFWPQGCCSIMVAISFLKGVSVSNP